jgi:8-oxo-dGTP pyrophosphatase MutT (NUDIX family)
MPRYRPSARLLILDPAGAILLFHFAMADGRRFWATAGGGLEAGEGFLDAARRELAEETGFDAAIDPTPIFERRFDFPLHDGEVVDGHELGFVVRAPRAAPSPANWTELEREMMTGHRWWTPAEIRASAEIFYPTDLADLAARAAAWPISAETPLP